MKFKILLELIKDYLFYKSQYRLVNKAIKSIDKIEFWGYRSDIFYKKLNVARRQLVNKIITIKIAIKENLKF